MVKEGLISKEEAILSLNIEKIEKLLSPIIDPKYENEILAKGLPASVGVVSGVIVFDYEALIEYSNRDSKTILVLKETSPNDIKGMHASSAILTTQGGMTSHAAVVARGLGKTCVTGARDIKIDINNKRFHCGGNFLTEGDIITINGENGDIFVGESPTIIPDLSESLKEIIGWCKKINPSKVGDIIDFINDTQKLIKK